jgi:1-acyl-sn-glycerol-3-phosphate acyltransferase
MSPAGALSAALLLLALPRLLVPRRAPRELRGVLGVLWWFNAGYCAFWHRLPVGRPEPLPPSGPALLIANHTCCIDHMLLQACTHRALGFMIAKELYDRPLFRPFCRLIGCIPVLRDGRDLQATRAALRALGEGRVVPVFPEGRITPRSGRVLGEGRPGVAFLALQARVPVIPAYIRGTPETNKVWPSYRTPSNARVTFGPPIDLSEYYRDGARSRDRLGDVTERLMNALRALKDRTESDGDGR